MRVLALCQGANEMTELLCDWGLRYQNSTIGGIGIHGIPRSWRMDIQAIAGHAVSAPFVSYEQYTKQRKIIAARHDHMIHRARGVDRGVRTAQRVL